VPAYARIMREAGDFIGAPADVGGGLQPPQKVADREYSIGSLVGNHRKPYGAMVCIIELTDGVETP
jgi:hypothetical protein